MHNSQFSTNNSLCLGNDTRQSHSYYGMSQTLQWATPFALKIISVIQFLTKFFSLSQYLWNRWSYSSQTWQADIYYKALAYRLEIIHKGRMAWAILVHSKHLAPIYMTCNNQVTVGDMCLKYHGQNLATANLWITRNKAISHKNNNGDSWQLHTNHQLLTKSRSSHRTITKQSQRTLFRLHTDRYIQTVYMCMYTYIYIYKHLLYRCM